jgi:DNA-binding response OmpR family regulator
MNEARKILIVDDEPVLRSLLEDNLTNEGFLVEAADCAKKALDRIRNNNYHLVILDLALPDMNGILLCQKIQQNHPELRGKIIFITGIGLDDTTSHHLKALAGAYLAKPFELNSLNRTVRKLLNPGESIELDTSERA